MKKLIFIFSIFMTISSLFAATGEVSTDCSEMRSSARSAHAQVLDDDARDSESDIRDDKSTSGV